MRIHEEYNASNVFVAGFRYGSGIDDHIGRAITGAGFAYYQDGLGNVTEVLDGAGTILQTYVYDAVGNIASQTGTAFNPYYSYTGREYDTESGLYYYRARYYDSSIGRFLSEDPIGFEGGDVNLYSYVKNSPINFIDPFGLQLEPSPERDALHCVFGIFAYQFFNLVAGNVKNSDKWYHCMANCIAVKGCGSFGPGLAKAFSDFKEAQDCKSRDLDSCDSLDEVANRQGRSNQGECCEKTCDRFDF